MSGVPADFHGGDILGIKRLCLQDMWARLQCFVLPDDSRMP